MISLASTRMLYFRLLEQCSYPSPLVTAAKLNISMNTFLRFPLSAN